MVIITTLSHGKVLEQDINVTQQMINYQLVTGRVKICGHAVVIVKNAHLIETVKDVLVRIREEDVLVRIREEEGLVRIREEEGLVRIREEDVLVRIDEKLKILFLTFFFLMKTNESH